jgi:predicted dienelactone hydrolase
MRLVLKHRWFAMVAIAALLSTSAHAAELGAGIQMVTLTDPVEKGPMAATVVYPSNVLDRRTMLGPFTIAAGMNAPPAVGTFPLVAISHGTGGNMFGHHGLMSSLARAGFVVASVEHPRDNYKDDSGFATALQIYGRSHHIVALIDGVLAHPTLGALVDKKRGVGMAGHSAGGYTALLSAGAEPNFGAAPTPRLYRTTSTCVAPLPFRASRPISEPCPIRASTRSC